ncbi:MAG: STAS domain-containing protein [Armatimonadota bacterium]
MDPLSRLMEEMRALPEEDDPVQAREEELLNSIAGIGDSPLAVRVQEREGIPVLRVEGELDVSTAPELQARMDEVLARSPSALVVDLSYADYIDSRGMGILLQASGRLPNRLAVVTPKERLVRLFQATGLSRRLLLHRTLPEALADLKE